MPFVLFLVLVALLIGTGLRALMGSGLAIFFFRTYRGRYAKPAGAVFLALGLGLGAWLVVDPTLAALLWQPSGR